MNLVGAAFIYLALAFGKADGQCCPEGAWNQLNNPDYEELGSVEKVGDMDLYRIGNSTKAVIWNYDIFGFNSGRTRQMADFLAANGYMTVIPDYYRGTFVDPSQSPREVTVQFLKDQSDWNGQLKQDFIAVKDHLKSLGATSIGAIGTCWGTYPVIRMAEDVDIKAGISMHPSHPNVIDLLGENEELILKEVKSPQFFLPSQSDSESVKKNGLGHQVLGDMVDIVEFPDMRHGWTVRGDLSDPAVDRDVKRAFNLVLAFLKKYL